MPGKAIEQIIGQHHANGFQEVSSIFRHDFVQFLGMLQSWMVLIEAEILATSDEGYQTPAQAAEFRHEAALLQRKVDHLFNEARSRLYPALDEQTTSPVQMLQHWDAYFSEFRTYARPRLNSLEKRTRQLVEHTAFADVVEKTLGAAAGDDTIADLILKPYTRLREVLDADHFDARVAELGNNASV